MERRPLSHLRRTIAERMALSAALIPHVTHFDRADITDLDALIRRNLDGARAREITLTLTSFILKAAALALGLHPHFNASLDPAAGELIVKRYCHLGVAVATERATPERASVARLSAKRRWPSAPAAEGSGGGNPQA